MEKDVQCSWEKGFEGVCSLEIVNARSFGKGKMEFRHQHAFHVKTDDSHRIASFTSWRINTIRTAVQALKSKIVQ